MTTITNLQELRKKYLANSLERLKEDMRKVPEDKMREWGAKIYMFINLTWGYVDSVIGMCRQLRLDQTKGLSRQIRELKRQYDQFRSVSLDDASTASETGMGEWFEEIYAEDFDRLFASLSNESCKGEKDEIRRMYLVALHQSLTLIEAVKRYARFVDSELKNYDVWVTDCVIVQNSFLQMCEVMKKFPTAQEERFKPIRELNSRILENRLHELTVGIENNNITMTKTKHKNG